MTTPQDVRNEKPGRAKAIFGDAIAIADPALRDEFVESCCSGDPELLNEVRSLLDADAPQTILRNSLHDDRTPASADVTTGIAASSPATAVHDESPAVQLSQSPPAPSSRLHFSPELEREYSAHNFAESLSRVRGSILLAVVLYSVFGVLDNWLAPGQRTTLWLIRLTIVVLALTELAYSYHSSFRRFWQPTMTVLITLGCFGIIAMVALIPPPGSQLYYAGLLLVTAYYSTLVRLSFVYAAVLSVVIFFSYLVVAAATATPGTVLLNNVMMLASGNIIVLFANLAFERHSRRDFWQRRVIRDRARELESRNDQLSALNSELVRSRAEIARSAARNELLFAALTEALPGTVLDDKYRLDEKIGSGGFGTVYRGFHLLLRRPVAVKLIKPGAGDMLSNVARFKREAITACRLIHPNGVHVFDFGVSGGSVAYLVMELLEGRPLAEELDGGARVSLQRCATIVGPICDLLTEAHRQGLIHRDLKPSNVFLHRAGDLEVVKIIDFGLAKVVGTTGPELQSVHLTAAGGIAGTPAYMPPERLMGHDGDAKSDVYSLGVIVFEMLTGAKPFAGDPDAPWPAAMKRLGERPPPLCSRNPLIPPAVGTIVDRALAIEPGDRPTAAEFSREFTTDIAIQSAT